MSPSSTAIGLFGKVDLDGFNQDRSCERQSPDRPVGLPLVDFTKSAEKTVVGAAPGVDFGQMG